MTDDMTSQQRPDTWDLVQSVKWWWSLECCSAWMFLLEEGRSVIVWFNIIAHGKTSETDWKYPYVNNSKGFTQGLIFGPFIFILLTYEVPLGENLKTVDCPLKTNLQNLLFYYFCWCQRSYWMDFYELRRKDIIE